MYKIARKISILIFTIWFAACVVYVMPQKKAEAFAPALIAVPAVAQVAGSLLVAAGVTCATGYALQSATDWYYSSASAATKTALSNAANNVVDGVVNVADDLWTSTRDWVAANFVAGGTSATITNALLNSAYSYGQYEYTSERIFNMTSTQDTVFKLMKIEITGTNVKRWGWSSGAWVLSAEYVGAVKYVMDYASGKNNIIFKNASNAAVATYNSSYAYLYDATQPSTTIAYTGESVISPTWDIKDQISGLRKIGFPITFDDLIGKKYTDVNKSITENPPANPPADTTFDGTSEITGLSSVFNAVKTMSANIAKFFDLATPINMEPLKLSGEIFTTRFPFSLPWDLMRSFQLFNDDSFSPLINIHIPAGPKLPALNFNIDLSMWTGIVPYVKAIELLLFDISLVLLTRKLLGGGV